MDDTNPLDPVDLQAGAKLRFRSCTQTTTFASGNEVIPLQVGTSMHGNPKWEVSLIELGTPKKAKNNGAYIRHAKYTPYSHYASFMVDYCSTFLRRFFIGEGPNKSSGTKISKWKYGVYFAYGI